MAWEFFNRVVTRADLIGDSYLGDDLRKKNRNNFFSSFESLNELHSFFKAPQLLPIAALSVFLVNMVNLTANILLMALSITSISSNSFKNSFSRAKNSLGFALIQPPYLIFDALRCLLALCTRFITTLAKDAISLCFSDNHADAESSLGLTA